MIVTIIVLLGLVALAVGIVLSRRGDHYRPDKELVGILLVVSGTFASIIAAIAIVVYSATTPVQEKQLANRGRILTQALESVPSYLTAATILDLQEYNSQVINWRRWEKSLLIGMWYADLAEDVTILDLPR